MSKTILIRGARQLLTLNGPSGPRRGDALNALGIIEDGAVLVKDGVVFAVGPSRRVENLAASRGAIDIHAAGHVVMPGFVDSHAHLIAGAALVDRDDVDTSDLGLMDSDRNRRAVMSLRQIRTTPAKVIEHKARRLVAGCARHGTTTLEAKSGHGLDENTEIKLLRVLGQLDNDPISVLSSFYVASLVGGDMFGSEADYLAWLTDSFIPRLASRKLASFIDVDCDAHEGKLETVDRILAAASLAGLLPKLHLYGMPYDYVTAATEARVRILSVDGLNEVGEPEAEMLAGSPVIATLMPADTMSGAAVKPAPARLLIGKGVAVSLGSGLHHGRTTTYNMQAVIALACSHLKMAVGEAISASTVNAAHAIGAGSRLGTLQFGKDADLIILGISDYRDLAFYFGVNAVQLTMKCGEIVYQDSGFRI